VPKNHFLRILLTIGICVSSLTVISPAIAKDEMGVTSSEILLGATFPLTGSFSPHYQDFYKGAQAYFSYLNKNGGIYGRKIRLVLRDDGGTPMRAVSAGQGLLAQDKVFALFNSAPFTAGHSAMVRSLGSNMLQVPNLAVTSDYSGFSDSSKYPTTFQAAPNALQEFKVLTHFIEQSFNSTPVIAQFPADDIAVDFQQATRNSVIKFGSGGAPASGCSGMPYQTDKFAILNLYRIHCGGEKAKLTAGDVQPLFIRGKSVSSSLSTYLVASSNSKNLYANFNMPLFTDEEDPFIYFFTRVLKEEIPSLDFSKQYMDSTKSVFNHVSQQLYEGANAAYVVSQAIAAIGSQPTRASLIKFLRSNSKSLSSASFSPIDYSTGSNIGDTVQYIAKYDGARWVKVSDFYLVNPTGNSVRVVTPLRNPLLANGIPVTKVAEQASRKIVCIKGKVTREVSGVNPKCPKGFKQR